MSSGNARPATFLPLKIACAKFSLRRHGKISASTWGLVAPWLDGVIPFGMERIAFDVERRHFCIADLDAFFIGVGVEFAADGQARLGRGRGDQLDDRRLTRERPT